jgi:type IV pilus assembly protein PilX
MRNQLYTLGKQSKQSGVVMFVALILLLILSLLGVTAARMQTVEERMARNDNNREIGAQAAEAALRAAEVGLITGGPSFANIGVDLGTYTPDLSNGSPLIGMNWGAPTAALPYPGPPLTALPVVSRTPKIVVEQMLSVAQPSDDISVAALTAPAQVNVYRVTAQGVGADGTSTTMLQTIVR